MLYCKQVFWRNFKGNLSERNLSLFLFQKPAFSCIELKKLSICLQNFKNWCENHKNRSERSLSLFPFQTLAFLCIVWKNPFFSRISKIGAKITTTACSTIHHTPYRFLVYSEPVWSWGVAGDHILHGQPPPSPAKNNIVVCELVQKTT